MLHLFNTETLFFQGITADVTKPSFMGRIKLFTGRAV